MKTICWVYEAKLLVLEQFFCYEITNKDELVMKYVQKKQNKEVRREHAWWYTAFVWNQSWKALSLVIVNDDV